MFTIATWNINSVRMRRLIVERLLNEAAPDVLFLQETKCQDGQFPAADFRKLYPRFDDGRERDDKLGYWMFREYFSIGFSYSI